jgi:hypothetical protein
MKRTKIICGFPGIGKTYFYNNNKDSCLDSDSSNFSWAYNCDEEKIRNDKFPANYIAHIKENIGKYDYILVSSHQEVRKALLKNCIHFYYVYPESGRKDEFIERYRKRGSPENFINLVNEMWFDWFSDILYSNSEDKGGFDYIELIGNENLSDVINNIDSYILRKWKTIDG